MKIDITSLYFNGETITKGNTASWGTALGQQKPDYPITVDGAKEIIELIDKNSFEFNPLGNPNHKANIRGLNDKLILHSGVFQDIYVNNKKFSGPFYLLVIEEKSDSHKGRKSLKYNNKIEVDGSLNQDFYDKISEYYGGTESCWFTYDISAKNNNLHLTTSFVSATPIIYQDNVERKEEWEDFYEDFYRIKALFKEYLTDDIGLKNDSTADKYINSLNKVENWLKKNNIVKEFFQIFNIRNDFNQINKDIESNHSYEWIEINKEKNRWYSTPWNHWLKFVDWYLDDISKNIVRQKGENRIYFGAPGTGKSHKVNEIIKGKNARDRTERVTFHPEYDYASFVGGYKPTMGKDEDGKETIRYEFVPQAFTKIYVDAWNAIANGEDKEFYLVIEEINRGNCAEIFGDIFQLLDRNSDYDITPSKELKEFLENEEKGLINVDYGLEGGKMKLPENLHILATMNTSDQSLFPMDSAFKRRWDWEYIPINYSRNSSENISASFKVELSEDVSFNWLDFIEKVNEIIKANDNLGMDKCLGNYFIKPDIDENTISLNSFINKAIFYLWNDVFKDEPKDEKNIFQKETTYEDFFPIDKNGIEKVEEILSLLEVDIESPYA